MKKFYTIGLIFTLLAACKNNLDESKENSLLQKVEDSIAKEEKKQLLNLKKAEDSILEIEQMKVISNIQFLMEKEDVEKRIKNFIQEIEKPKYSDAPELKYPFIGNFEVSHNGIRGYYKDNKLYMLKITGGLISWEKFNTRIPQELHNIKKVIELKYGEPLLNQNLPERYQVNSNGGNLIYGWKIGIKNIDIHIEESGQFYKINVYIYLPNIVEMINDQNEAVKNNKAEKDKNLF